MDDRDRRILPTVRDDMPKEHMQEAIQCMADLLYMMLINNAGSKDQQLLSKEFLTKLYINPERVSHLVAV